MVPASPNSLFPEAAATLERRRESLVKKAKEYHRELEALRVSSHSDILVPTYQLIKIIYRLRIL